MRVLHVHSGNLYGGLETTLIAQAANSHLSPELKISFALCFEGRFSEELQGLGASIDWLGDVKIRQPLLLRRARRKLRDLLQRQPSDVVVTHSCWSQAIFGPAVRDAGMPLVFYLHGAANGKHWLERWARRTVPEMVLCNSRFTASTLDQLYPQISAEVVYCPVAPPTLCYSKVDIDRKRAELNTPPEATVIIQVSRMESWKGHLEHLKALSLIKDWPGWVCWQVGGAQSPVEQKYLAELKNKARELGIAERVRFLDQRTDVAELLASADIFCQPNTAPEPFGIAFIEALYARLPVVTTSIGGACEIVNETCGVLVPPGELTTLASSLRMLIQDTTLRTKLGAAGPERARELCDPRKQMKRINEVLASIPCQALAC